MAGLLRSLLVGAMLALALAATVRDLDLARRGSSMGGVAAFDFVEKYVPDDDDDDEDDDNDEYAAAPRGDLPDTGAGVAPPSTRQASPAPATSGSRSATPVKAPTPTKKPERVTPPKEAAREGAAAAAYDDGTSATLVVRDSLSNEQRGAISFNPGSKKGKMTGGDLSTGEQEALMAASADGGLYTVSIPSNIHIDAPPYIQASTRACAMLASGGRQRLVVHADHFGSVRGLEVVPIDVDCSEVDVASASPPTSIRSDVRISYGGDAPRLSVDTFVTAQKEKVAAAKEGNKSFLAKYWMYIVPVVLLLLFMPGGGDGGGGSGGS